jgi:hypothetical protein
MAGFSPVTTAGALAKINFSVVGKSGDSCEVRLTSCRLNDGTPASATQSGKVYINYATGVEWGAEIPRELRLYQNKPNPFNASTTIQYDIPLDSGVQPIRLEVFDIQGKIICTLIDSQQPPGSHFIVWDGRDKSSRQVPSGVYFAKFYIGQHIKILKMILTR